MFVYDRYLLIKNKKNWFNNKISFKYLALFNVTFGLLVWSPIFASNLINNNVVNSTDLGYYLVTTPFGQSKFYAFYMIIINVGYDLYTAIAVGTLSIMLIIEYRKFMRSSIRETHSNSKSESDFTKVTLIIGLIHILTRLLHLVSIFFKFTYSSGVINTPMYFGYSLNIVFLFAISSLSLNLFILVRFNSKFRSLAMQALRPSTSKTNRSYHILNAVHMRTLNY